MPTSTRVTVTIPDDVLGVIDELAQRLNCSRSALISGLLSQNMPVFQSLVSCLPALGSEIGTADVRRFRGDSARIIGDQVSRLISGAQDDMF